MSGREEWRTNLRNSLWALLFGVTMWALINENLQQTRENVPVEVHVIPPPGFVVLYGTPDGGPPAVTVSIRAPSSELAKRGEGLRIEAVYDFRNSERAGKIVPGREEALSLSEFRLNLGHEIQIVPGTFDPPTILVRLVQEASDDLPVVPRIVEVPAGWSVEIREVRPPLVRVSGPRTALAETKALQTEPVAVRPLLERLGSWRAEAADPVTLDELSVRLDTAAAKQNGLSLELDRVTISLVVRPEDHERTVEIVPELLKPFPFPGTPLRLKPAFGAVRFVLLGPRRLLEGAAEQELLRHRVLAVLEPEVQLRPNSVTDLEVWVYPPAGVRVKDAERRDNVYVLPKKFTVEVEQP